MRWAGHAARRERREMNTEFRGGETEGKETAWKNFLYYGNQLWQFEMGDACCTQGEKRSEYGISGRGNRRERDRLEEFLTLR